MQLIELQSGTSVVNVQILQVVAGQTLVDGAVMKTQDQAGCGVGQKCALTHSVNDWQVGSLDNAQAHGLLTGEDWAGRIGWGGFGPKGLPAQIFDLKTAIDQQFTAPGCHNLGHTAGRNPPCAAHTGRNQQAKSDKYPKQCLRQA